MLEVGLWIQTETGEVFLVKKDPSGHPNLSIVKSNDPLDNTQNNTEDKKAKLRELYHQLTGNAHPHPHATSRQLMWDFLEAAIKQLP
jgi:hypothetical protein